MPSYFAYLSHNSAGRADRVTFKLPGLEPEKKYKPDVQQDVYFRQRRTQGKAACSPKKKKPRPLSAYVDTAAADSNRLINIHFAMDPLSIAM